MQPGAHSNKALSKEETKVLLTLIEGSSIINIKTTNATSNKMKVEEWARITDSFNATIGLCRRTPQQLRLKWENLKKNSRKRSASMQMERIKTGDGQPVYFPPNEVLDRVAALLSNTVEDLVETSGGDAGPQSDGDCGGAASKMIIPLNSGDGSPPLLPLSDSPLSSNILTLPPDNGDKSNSDIEDELDIISEDINMTPRVSNTSRRGGLKRRLLKPDDGRRARNLALAKYYNLKSKLLESKFKNVVLENEKLKLQIRKLKGEVN